MTLLFRNRFAAFVFFLAVNSLVLCGRTTTADERKQDIPSGRMTRGVFESSEVFPGTRRSFSVYVPAQYTADVPANLMVFMDGRNYEKSSGAFQTPRVFDRLIAEGKMPVTVAVFVDPGTIPATQKGASNRSNRSFEYDSLGDRYTRFLIDEFLPVATKGLNISSDPTNRAACGISSGAICAFTVAWERPDQFGKVMSHIGSYTNIRGGWAYPGLVRKSHKDPKPIKVYLQEGRDDLSNLHGSWPLGNRDLAAALQFAGYHYRFVMTDGGHSGKWAGQVFEDGLQWLWDENSKPTRIPDPSTQPDWQIHPDAMEQADVPKGRVLAMPPWTESKVFPGTTRDWWVYVPAQYTDEKPAALMVFQDGQRMQETRRWRIPIVFDNLISKGEMPPTIAVFINPGHEASKPRKNGKHSNRGLEYDSLGDRYSQFLIDEIIPEVRKKYSISDNPNMHAIGGSSSGGICAFTVAWERPDYFRRVFTNVGSFTHLRGGNAYPALVRKTEPKPLRISMVDTSGDVDNAFGSWPIANQRMEAALRYMGYDVHFDWAEGYAHNADYGSMRFPDAMKWLWREDQHEPTVDTSDDLRGDLTLLDLLIPNESWEVAVDNLGFADGLCSDQAGNLFFCDMRAPAVIRFDPADGTQTVIARESVSGLEFNSDETLLYACQGSKNRVVSIDPKTGTVKTVAENVKPNDLAVTAQDFILITETGAKQITLINPDTGKTTIVDTGIVRPNGITLSNDNGTLAVSSSGTNETWTFRVSEDGTLDAKMPTMPMRLRIDPTGDFRFNEPPPYVSASRGDGMSVDKRGRYYITSSVGVQIFDPTGRPCGVLPKIDEDQPLTSCILAGTGHETLFIAHGQRIYKRRLTINKN